MQTTMNSTLWKLALLNQWYAFGGPPPLAVGVNVPVGGEAVDVVDVLRSSSSSDVHDPGCSRMTAVDVPKCEALIAL